MSTPIAAKILTGLWFLGLAVLPVEPRAEAAELARVPVYGVAELAFAGPACGPTDAPARDVDLRVVFRHESGSPRYTVHGFWDGDGQGGPAGNVFKVRFCPTAPGRWTLVEIFSNVPALADHRQGDHVTAVPSTHKGFWLADADAPGGRWFRRSDGSHPYIVGNTHYTFVSECDDRGPLPGSIAPAVAANAPYFNKLRFGIHGCRYPHPTDKPFFDEAGRPTDDGNHSLRPNPAWFHRRVDAAVRAAYEHDVIADLILNGPDVAEARTILKAGANGGDPTPLLKYVAARYGAYPNVWFCLCNEWSRKKPNFPAADIVRFGQTIRRVLPYPTPLSVHDNTGDWNLALNSQPPWHSHVIIQHKIKNLATAADTLARQHARGGGDRPVIDDELAYEGQGDQFSEADVLEGLLGAFLGGAYGTTGHKPSNKKGHYFWGRFRADEHAAADNLGWMRARIDQHVAFWHMRPVAPADSIFPEAPAGARALAWTGREYVLGTNAAAPGLSARLPEGTWTVRRLDVLAMEDKVLAEAAAGTFAFDAPDSRAVLFHFKRNP